MLGEAGTGYIGDPLRLPYARILQEVQQIRVSEAYRRMVTMAAARMTLGQQEDLFADAVKGLSDSDFQTIVRAFDQLIDDMMEYPFVDLLGPVYMQIAHVIDKAQRGEFYTPHSLNVLLSVLALGDNPAKLFRPGKILECNEPSAGSAGMVLAYSGVLVDHGISPLGTRWVVQDISATACYAAYINTSLWGIPAVVVCGDTLLMTTNWAWANVHYASTRPHIPSAAEYAREVQQQRCVQAMRDFINDINAPKEAS